MYVAELICSDILFQNKPEIFFKFGVLKAIFFVFFLSEVDLIVFILFHSDIMYFDLLAILHKAK